MKIIDVHAHIYPQKIAEKATEAIGQFYNQGMERNGSLGELIRTYQETGVDHVIVNSAAVTVRNVETINQFIASSVAEHPDFLYGFGTIRPDCPDIGAVTEQVRTLGLGGFKIHPDMQKFALDDPQTIRMFQEVGDAMPFLIHTGDRRYRFSRPEQMRKAALASPHSTMICAHFGGWSQWEEGIETLGDLENCGFDTSSSLYFMTPEKATELIRHTGVERFLFGVDFPMWDPQSELERFDWLLLSDDEKEQILGLNAICLLNL